MLRETPYRRLHRWGWRRQWGKIRWRPRTRRGWTRGFRQYSHITVIVRSGCGWWWIWLTIVTILTRIGIRWWGWEFCITITIITIRFTGVIWVRFITNVRWARGRWWWLINDFIMTIGPTWSSGGWRWWIYGIGYHTGTICCGTRSPSDMIAIIWIHAGAWI